LFIISSVNFFPFFLPSSLLPFSVPFTFLYWPPSFSPCLSSFFLPSTFPSSFPSIFYCFVQFRARLPTTTTIVPRAI
jgi:hypothetical protein